MKSRALISSSVLLALACLAYPAVSAAAGAVSAAQTLSACVQANGRLSVLFLMDESGSIRFTDPTAARVAGLRDALGGLADLADTSVDGREPQVDVLFAGFSDRFAPDPNSASVASDWKAVNAQSLAALDSDAGSYADLNGAPGTDYGSALLDARQLLASRSAAVTLRGGENCTAIVLFTDGGYDLAGRKASGLGPSVSYAPTVNLYTFKGLALGVKAGVQMMCRPGGLMDGLVSDGVVLFTVGLNPTRSDGAFLEAFTTGRAAGTRCGSRVSSATGSYIDVHDSARLFFAFSDLLDGFTPTQVPHPLCAAQPCARGLASFRVLSGLDRFVIRTTTGAVGPYAGAIQIVLEAPNGLRATLSPQTDREWTMSGALIQAEWVSPAAVDIDATLPATTTAWVGTWSFAYVDPSGRDPAAVPISTIELYPAIAAHLTGAPAILRGAPSRLYFTLTGPGSSSPSPSPLLAAARLAVTASDPTTGRSSALTVSRAPAAAGYSVAIDLPASSQAPDLRLEATTTFALSDGTATIVPTLRTFVVPTRLPEGEGFPSVAPADLLLPSVRGRGRTRGVITVTASSDAAGCVWVSRTSVGSPSAGVSLTTSPLARSATACLHLGPAQSRRIAVTFHVARAQSGRVQSTIALAVTSAITPGTRVTTVEAGFAVSPAPNLTKRVAIVVVLTVLGALIPLLVLATLNWWGARFVALDKLLYVARDVELTPGGELVAADHRPLDVRPSALEDVAGERSGRSVRSLSLDGGRFRFVTRAIGRRSERRPSLVLALGPYAVVETDAGSAVAGARNSKLAPFPAARRHQVPLALAQTWIFDPVARTDDRSSLEDAGDALADYEPAHQPPLTGRLLLIVRSSHDTEPLLGAAEEALLAHAEDLGEWARAAHGEVTKNGRASLWRRRAQRKHAPPPPEPDLDEIFRPD